MKSFMRQRENGISLSLLRCSSNGLRAGDCRKTVRATPVYVVVKMKLRLVLILD